jgi:uncharacterized protein YbjT (DUF2867 family)
MNVLVTGATGYVGGRLAPRLSAAGHRVICLARDPEQLAGREWGQVEVRRGDALEPASLRAALQGVEAAYYLIHSMAEGAHGFEDRDRQAAHNFGAAAREAGVRRIVYLGGLGQADDRLSTHLASRHEVGEILRASGVPVTEFRAAIVVGSGSISFEMIRYLTERLPVMITPRWVQTNCQPIAIDDVLEYLARCLDEPRSVGRIFEIGGPDVLTYGDMMHGYARVRGLRRHLIPVPVLTPRLSSYWVDLVTPIPANYSRPLIEGLRSEVIVRDPAAREVFDIPLTPYREAVRLALEHSHAGDIETYWAGAAGRPARPEAGVSVTQQEGLIREERRVPANVPPPALYEQFVRIGGRRGWYYAGWAWRLRGLADRMAGGVGLRRGRRHPDELRAGDALDFWRVEAVQPGRLVRLSAEMRLPGRAWLQFEAAPAEGGGSVLIQTASFAPRGLAGLAYWYGLYPFHQLIFSGLSRAIVRRAETYGLRIIPDPAPGAGTGAHHASRHTPPHG